MAERVNVTVVELVWVAAELMLIDGELGDVVSEVLRLFTVNVSVLVLPAWSTATIVIKKLLLFARGILLIDQVDQESVVLA